MIVYRPLSKNPALPKRQNTAFPCTRHLNNLICILNGLNRLAVSPSYNKEKDRRAEGPAGLKVSLSALSLASVQSAVEPLAAP